MERILCRMGYINGGEQVEIQMFADSSVVIILGNCCWSVDKVRHSRESAKARTDCKIFVLLR